MALSPHSRTFTLHVTDVDVSLFEAGCEDFDSIELIFHGKVLPSTKQRLNEAMMQGSVKISEKTLT